MVPRDLQGRSVAKHAGIATGAGPGDSCRSNRVGAELGCGGVQSARACPQPKAPGCRRFGRVGPGHGELRPSADGLCNDWVIAYVEGTSAGHELRTRSTAHFNRLVGTAHSRVAVSVVNSTIWLSVLAS
jgi:hypothetical protein